MHRIAHRLAIVAVLWFCPAGALAAPPATMPAGWTRLRAGELAAAFEQAGGGIHLRSLRDVATEKELAAGEQPPLFALTLKHAKTGELLRLAGDVGWQETRAAGDSDKAELRWSHPARGPAGLAVAATAQADAPRGRIAWKLAIHCADPNWAIWQVAFPQLAIGPFADPAHLLLPQAAGVVHRDIWRKAASFKGTYPDGWCAMQFLAAYDPSGKTGLYVALHDPAASVKDLAISTDTARRRLNVAFDHPAPNMGVAGTGFALSGQAVWQLLRGDWFDACLIYRDWVRREAPWWPKLGPDDRADTPAWMRELPAWALLGGGPQGATKQAAGFAEAIGLPVGFHWYSWHRIPFDNDYPHYFPPKDGFAEAVAAIQGAAGRPAYVMPYINGRLWDTRDQDANDLEFTKLALPAATKDEKGRPCVESYGSKEKDGSDVKLAVMCPTTQLWQQRVQGIVLRLMKECGVRAVYIDQIAAAKPRLCFDATHGHPLGGGPWWVAAYGKLLADLRKAMPEGCAITTECNAEPYLPWFDGYLTWHWQHDGQVPAFPAVYGGAIQLFGRAYRGGPTKDLALRMKAGQQLVFGEQIGWVDASVANEKDNVAFLRQMAQVRRHLGRFFHAGQMARPPKLAGTMPTVTADWQWQGTWPVTTDAVLAGAWELPREGKLALIFVNVSDKPVEAELAFDAATYGLAGQGLKLTTMTAGGPAAAEEAPARFSRRLTFEPLKAWAWLLEASPGRP